METGVYRLNDVNTEQLTGVWVSDNSPYANFTNLSYGWFGGGANSGNTTITYVQRISYVTDTAVASVRGNLAFGTYQLAGVGNSTNGWFGGGNNSAGASTSYVQGITYATDTALTSLRGNL